MEIKRSVLICFLIALTRVDLTLSQATSEKAPKQTLCDDSVVRSVSKQCRNAAKIKTLDEFYAFYESFDHLTNKCLRPNSPSKKASLTSLLAEDECSQQKLSFYQVRQLAKLVGRFRSPGGQVCNLEFTLRLYHLQNQLEPHQLEQQTVLTRILRLLGNSVAWKCRLTLAKRLKNVQSRAPDTQRYITFIMSLVNLGSGDELVSKLKPFEHVSQFVPTLERELPDRDSGHANSIGQDGYELKSVNVVRLSYDSVKMSCKAIKMYQVNILGSLGLLASLGYGAPAALEASAPQLKLDETRADKQLIQLWLMTSLLCQSLSNVLKMKTNTVEGKLLYRFKIMPTQEADVSLADEFESTFSTFRLPESISSEAQDELHKPEVVELLTSYRNTLAATESALNRRANLLTGPNYKLSQAIGTYLDVSQKEGRLEAIESVLGLKLEFEDLGNDEEDEEEEEEEED